MQYALDQEKPKSTGSAGALDVFADGDGCAVVGVLFAVVCPAFGVVVDFAVDAAAGDGVAAGEAVEDGGNDAGPPCDGVAPTALRPPAPFTALCEHAASAATSASAQTREVARRLTMPAS